MTPRYRTASWRPARIFTAALIAWTMAGGPGSWAGPATGAQETADPIAVRRGSPSAGPVQGAARPLPDLDLHDLDGVARSLRDWRGRVVLLNFWATWCPPCQFEIPRFVDYQRRYGEAGLQVVSVGLDERRKLANVARTMAINYPVLVGQRAKDLDLLPAWGDKTRVLPYTVIIGRDGSVVHRQQGIMEQVTFEDFVLPLLVQTGPPTRR